MLFIRIFINWFGCLLCWFIVFYVIIEGVIVCKDFIFYRFLKVIIVCKIIIECCLIKCKGLLIFLCVECVYFCFKVIYRYGMFGIWVFKM